MTARLLRGVVALGAIGAIFATVAPARAASAVHATYNGVTSTCRDDGLDFGGQIELVLPAASTVGHTYRVFNSTHSRALGTDDTPVPAPVTTTIAFSDPQFFGGAWTDGLPFTYEQTTQVLIVDASGSSSTSYTQIVAVSCTVAGASGVVTVTEPVAALTTTTSVPAPDPTPGPAAAPVVAQPHFTG